ncbi:MAG: T9SS type A sorting domain-containing protein [Saprospiraceae bacterium]
MKQALLLLLFVCAGHFGLKAQMPNGSNAPNFTVVSITGQSYTLYTLLDSGYTVYIDFFATWCGPCWNYHNTHSLQELWEQYGPSGSDEVFVLGIEGDCSTNTQCITASPGCNDPNNQGNWSNGVTYPLVDNCSVRGQYQVGYYPTIYMICPADRKVYEVGQQGPSGLWSARETYCPPLVVNTTVNNVNDVICYGSNTGSIDISVSGGSGPYTYNWSNGAHTQDLTNIPAGTYSCTIYSAQGWPGETGPITVDGPAEPLALAVTGTTPVGCNGVFGSITVAGGGGWGGHEYNWNNGQDGQEASGLSAGTYTCTLVDSRGCTKTVSHVLPPAALPIGSIAPPGTVTCATPNVQLSGSASGGYSGTYTFSWTAWNGGNIVSGANTPNPIVNAGGNYTMQVTDAVTTCSGFSTTVVLANVTLPNSEAGPNMTVTCALPTTVLSGSGSTGNNITYLWTAYNGGHIVSGANTFTPTVDAAGNYVLAVTNNTNGCVRRDTTGVTGNNIPPTAQSTGGELTCVVNAVTLNATTNANNPTFVWTGPNNFQSTEQNPTVEAEGSYALVVTDPNTGCTNTSVAAVGTNTEAPGAEADGGTVTCVTTTITLDGSATSTNATFAWTGPNGFTSAQQNPSTTVVGAYSLITTDTLNGCTSTASATVGENTTPPTASATTPGNLNCNVSELVLNGTGSSQGSNMAYAWTTADGNIVSGATTPTPTVDAPGTYSLVVTNSDNGCTANAATAVVENAPVSATTDDVVNVLCFGGNNGEATAVPAGGNSSYTYLWSTGENTATIGSLAAGTYSVVVTDGDNCSATTSVEITQPPVLAPNASATAQTAANTNDGTATAVPTGGTGDYTYAWDNGETMQTITGLAPGSYTVIVTDENGCTSSQTVIVNAFNCTIEASASNTNITCFGANNGTAIVNLTGANDPVTITWSTGANTPDVTNLAPGTYTVQVIDNTNCADVQQVVVTEPTALETNASATGETFAGANDGTATAAPTGGTGNYTYSWSNGETSQSITNLPPATYTVIVTDENGCTNEQIVVVNAFSCVVTGQPAATPVVCFGQNNGGMSVSLTGATEPYTFLWSTGETTSSIQNLAPGTYTASVTDANGCGVVVEGTVTEPTALEIVSASTNPACAGEASGSIETNGLGGTGTYSYVWNTGANTSDLQDLLPGTYNLVLSDANGCTSTASYTLVVADNVAPLIAAQNTTLPLGTSGSTTVTLQTLGASVTDNCAVANVAIEPGQFDCSDLGEQTVTITATDNAGNSSVSTVTVQVVDNTPPTVECPSSISQCWYETTVTYNAPVAFDNCLGFGGSWKMEEGLPSGSDFPVGETDVMFTYTDESGNTGSCLFTVTIGTPIQVGPPVVTNDMNNQGVGSIDITVLGGSGPYNFLWTNSQGQTIATTEDVSGLTSGTYFVEIRDANGCRLSNEGIVVDNTSSAVEPTWLRGAALRPNPTSGVAHIVFGQMPASDLEVTVNDATGRTLRTFNFVQQYTVYLDCSDLPEGVYTVRFRSGSDSGVRKLAIVK